MTSSGAIAAAGRVPLGSFAGSLAVLALLALVGASCSRTAEGEDAFVRWMNVGKNYYDKGEAEKALAAFQQALKANPTQPDVHLNLANVYLIANQPTNALRHAQELLQLQPTSAAGHYLSGCAYSRLRQFEAAVKELQIAKDLDKTINAVSFQLGRAHQEVGHYEDARQNFEEVLQFEPDHPAANYNLSQVLIRLGATDEAKAALDRHQQTLAQKPGQQITPTLLERCQYTEARAPFKLEQPDKAGVKVAFTDATQTAFGAAAGNYRGPVGVLDIDRRGQNDLFVLEGADSFRVLFNTNGIFQPLGDPLPRPSGAAYGACLVGDLNNDRIDDLIMLGEKSSHVFRFATNGAAREITPATGLRNLTATTGLLTDIGFTGFLGLVAVTPETNAVRIFRNLGSIYFKDITATSGIPALTGVRQIAMDDWNGDDLLDLFATRDAQPPLLLSKVRGGPMVETNTPPTWPSGSAIAVSDLNNDLRNDLVVATSEAVEVLLSGVTEKLRLPLAGKRVSSLRLIDYDNDGWLDVVATGEGLRVWRNLGLAGFKETTGALGLDKVPATEVEHFAAADFDNDGDTDFLVSPKAGGLRLLRNDGGNANQQIKVRLLGNRSNASGLGIKIELASAGLRQVRTVTSLPVEIGVGAHRQLDSLTVHWFDLQLSNTDVKVDPRAPLDLIELQLAAPGSCPYLYAWDGQRFRFVTDLLGAAPLGLPAGEGRYIDADTEEFVWLGDEQMFPPRDGAYVLQITEELREVLYLDTARLFVVDHPPDTEVHPTSKLRPGRPFPPHELVTVRGRTPLRRAVQTAVGTARTQAGRPAGQQAGEREGRRPLDSPPYAFADAEDVSSTERDVTALLAEKDGLLVSPTLLRLPQLRGQAEPYSLVLDFGPLDTQRPLVLVMTGWLRFGGGMANMAASGYPGISFPFPTLEVETSPDAWQPVDVVIGAPAGKTKTILVDLAGKLPAGARRLRLTMGFEIHWDRLALFERAADAATRVASFLPTKTDLHWRGFGELEDLPWYHPLTPSYERVRSMPNWRLNVSGWSTRYGPVDELLAKRDDALVLVNAGDELTLGFAAERLPPKPPGYARDFFLFTEGWDKDADFHVVAGTTVEPLPWHGMDDQRYGHQPRPVIDGDWWISKYNTRWVGPLTFSRSK
jgi:Flp pilus assembly protein TadD